MATPHDTTTDLTQEADRPSESLGEMSEARFKAAPDEVRAGTDAALAKAFPEAKD